jgi:hypothetical protein
MTQIDELNTRITRALERITAQIEGWDPAMAAEAATAAQAEALTAAQEAAAKAEAARDSAEQTITDLREAVTLAQQQAEAKQTQLDETLEALRAAETEAEEAKARAETPEQALAEARDAGPLDSADSADTAAGEPEAIAAPGASSAELDDLRTALEDERLANAQLEERIKVLHQRLTLAASAPQPAAEPDAAVDMAQIEEELHRLRNANEAMRETSQALREANAKGVGEPHLINAAMLKELEAIRADRAVEMAEARAILAAIDPLLPEAQDQQTQEAGA